MKILVTGLGCSGKSTIARRIGEVTDLPVHHLDRLLWKSDWVRASQEEFLTKQSNILSGKEWVYEGFNPKTLSVQVHAADSIVYLKVSHLKLTYNWLKRLWKYRKNSRPDMADGNIEKFNWPYLKWLWKYGNDEMIADIKHLCGSKELVIISNNTDRKKYLGKLMRQKNYT
jgi:adenylate kinase family enzyme